MDMKPGELLAYWEKTASGRLTSTPYPVRLPLEDAAKLEALAQMYPKKSLEQLVADLLSSALHELEESMPYIKGSEVVAHDEFGDEIYEDAGPTSRFLSLSQQKLAELKEKN
ncbi:type 1 pili tip component [Gilvimarinus algae]|uniref:Type 1 pili tip component n=1 Tax=Gilvimarinus algae TaxID=3058037 RepID=A0ABT8TEW9_9GAMM|nr:type 1 pili tip component [Gilvimarinus sp. SDUM040014]MDO3382637.1 type 1 pili tip component [Gilvimarinus sp. SDUM040014]